MRLPRRRLFALGLLVSMALPTCVADLFLEKSGRRKILKVKVLWRRGGAQQVGRAKQIFAVVLPLGAALKAHEYLLTKYLVEKGETALDQIKERGTWRQAQLVAACVRQERQRLDGAHRATLARLERGRALELRRAGADPLAVREALVKARSTEVGL